MENEGEWERGAPGETTSRTDPGHPGYARSSVREQAARAKQRAMEKGTELKENVKDTAERKAEEIKEGATRRTDEITSRIGSRIEILARAIRRAGEELRNEGEPRFAEVTDEAAVNVERLGLYLEGREPHGMMTDARRTARNHPAYFVGSTFLLGLLVGRFLKADEPEPERRPQEPEGRFRGEDERSQGYAAEVL